VSEEATFDQLLRDLNWQIDQLKSRGVKTDAGNPYNPTHYKRGLITASEKGGPEVVAYVRRYLYKPPSAGYLKLEQADSLDLTCEYLVANDAKPYASLFTDEDRAAARERLGPHIKALKARRAKHRAAVIGVRNEMRAKAGKPPLTEAQLALA
jgi:hypothetical protein